ncbi:universal stress protein [Ferrimonas marina]|uniref:Nucleotide-binding universal stress protein, UspA family n=1 Tax=Ferrimonas marina TaxID=299255 RepID=A0A1M5YQM2_9GAMM|nr:universal stress protein [Ferrimonas marina]SHI14169.1 Nucleotide-binding universal stress protein, UspA family [Ferrimonas marina]
MAGILAVTPAADGGCDTVEAGLQLALAERQRLLVLHSGGEDTPLLDRAACGRLSMRLAERAGVPVELMSVPEQQLLGRILALCQAHQFDLLIKSQHRPESGHNTDWQLLRRLTIPLLLLRPGAKLARRRVLAALDLGHRSGKVQRLNVRVLAMASRLAHDRHAQLHVVYTPHLSRFCLDLNLQTAYALEQRAAARHEQHLGWLAAAGVPRERVHIKAGNPGLVMRELADALEVETLVVGCFGRAGLMACLQGNTAERVIRHLGHHLLVVPGRATE